MAERTLNPPGGSLEKYAVAPALLLAVLCTQWGCSREFFRNWANQDVSEAVFEKTRDPRWRMDTFSIEPPALSRFADPYDQDFPPAPPDDAAAEALSPMPQRPDNRLIVPLEANGYMEMLQRWEAERQALADAEPPREPAPGAAPAPAPATTPSPFSQPDAAAPPTDAVLNVGGRRDPAAAPPVLLADARGAIPPPRTDRAAKPAAGAAAIPPPRTDQAVKRAAFQEPFVTDPDRPLSPAPRAPMEPNPSGRDLADPNIPRPGQMVPEREDGAFSQEQAAELSGILVPEVAQLDDARAAGLPPGQKFYRINMQQAFTLALINSRFYQTQLENIYNSALAVTLQRFAFQPQFYAGMTPSTSPLGAGFPALNPSNAFNYQRRYAPGGQISGLQISEVAGVGKLLNSGGRLLLGFANQVIFNFAGKNPIQPTVQSSLPLSFVQPLLRGGGRAVTLEALTLAERALLYQVRAFAKFRQEFIVSVLIGGTVQNLGSTFALAGFSSGGNTDPVVGFIPVVLNAAQIEIDMRNVATMQQIVNLYKQLIDGEASGLTLLQVDQAQNQLISGRRALAQDTLTYRSTLDQYKMQLGLPPDTPLAMDMSMYQPFKEVFKQLDAWQRDRKRDLKELPRIVGRLPELQDIVIDDRSVLSVYKKSDTGEAEDEQLEDILQSAVRTALEYRLDMMNNRAQLYDAWRQIRFRANALKGILNVGLTNQILTPPTDTNPFGFLSQAQQVSLVLNAELPLIRVSERNAFRQAIISYQQQRRSLMSAEDGLKYQLRQDVRSMQIAYYQYSISKQQLELQARLKDQAFEQLVAPPAATSGNNLAATANASTQTQNLLNAQASLINFQGTILSTWQNFQNARLVLYRDIGTLPYDEWEAFSELFPAEYRGPSLGPGTGDTRPAAAATAETP